jgi:hypothetical protein
VALLGGRSRGLFSCGFPAGCATSVTVADAPVPAATADQLRDTIASSGFEILEWIDETPWVLRWFEDLGKRIASGGSAATLPALLNDGPTRMMNLAIALTTGVVSVQRGSFIRPDPPRYPR